MLPFRKNPLTTDKNTRYWTADGSRDLKLFGYTYPDIADATKSAEQLRADFAAKYGWSRRLTPFQVSFSSLRYCFAAGVELGGAWRG